MTLPSIGVQSDLEASQSARRGHAVGRLAPGLALTCAIAAIAYALRTAPELSAFSPMILAIVVGAAFRAAFGAQAWGKEGSAFSLRRLLRLAIILLGLQLTATQVAEVGASGVAIIALTLVATFVFTTWLGRLLGVSPKLAQLIAAGTSICGASAIVAANAVTRGDEEDVAYAVACVTVFGSVAMFVYPLLPGLLGLAPHAYGLWSGASIHEVAQAVAAGFAHGAESGEAGTVAKLTRVAMLAPVVLLLGTTFVRRASRAGGEGASVKTPTPWFVIGFIALACLNSAITIPPDVKEPIVALTAFLLTVALAAMGLGVDVAKLKAKGLRPFLLGLAAFLFIASFSLALVKLTT